MPIITLEQAKIFMQITDNSQDALITALIPIVQRAVIKYCNNSFLNYYVQYLNSTLAFSSNKITDSNNGFITNYFIAGDYKVFGSKYNDGIYTITTVAAGELTAEETFVTEAAGETIMLTKVEFPLDIQFDVANYLKQMMNTQSNRTVVSESLPGGYSVTYAQDVEQALLRPFDRFRKPYEC